MPSSEGEFTFEAATQFKTPKTNQRVFPLQTPESKGTSPLNVRDTATTEQMNSIANTLNGKAVSERPASVPATPKPKNDDEDFQHLSHLSAMPGSWIVEQKAQFESQDNQQIDQGLSDIVNSLNKSQGAEMQRDFTFESLKGELQEDNSAANTNPYGNAPEEVRKSVISVEVPQVPDDTPSGKSNFKQALESMLTNAFGWKEEAANADSPSKNAALTSTSSDETTQEVSDIANNSAETTETTADTTANTVNTDELPDSSTTSVTPGKLNFDSEKSPATSAFTFLRDEETRSSANPVSNDSDNLFNRASTSSSVYPDNRTSTPLAAIPESRTFELRAEQEDEENLRMRKAESDSIKLNSSTIAQPAPRSEVQRKLAAAADETDSISANSAKTTDTMTLQSDSKAENEAVSKAKSVLAGTAEPEKTTQASTGLAVTGVTAAGIVASSKSVTKNSATATAVSTGTTASTATSATKSVANGISSVANGASTATTGTVASVTHAIDAKTPVHTSNGKFYSPSSTDATPKTPKTPSKTPESKITAGFKALFHKRTPKNSPASKQTDTFSPASTVTKTPKREASVDRSVSVQREQSVNATTPASVASVSFNTTPSKSTPSRTPALSVTPEKPKVPTLNTTMPSLPSEESMKEVIAKKKEELVTPKSATVDKSKSFAVAESTNDGDDLNRSKSFISAGRVVNNQKNAKQGNAKVAAAAATASAAVTAATAANGTSKEISASGDVPDYSATTTTTEFTQPAAEPVSVEAPVENTVTASEPIFTESKSVTVDQPKVVETAGTEPVANKAETAAIEPEVVETDSQTSLPVSDASITAQKEVKEVLASKGNSHISNPLMSSRDRLTTTASVASSTDLPPPLKIPPPAAKSQQVASLTPTDSRFTASKHGPKVISVSSSVYSIHPRTSAYPNKVKSKSTLHTSEPLSPVRASDVSGLTQTITASFSTTTANAEAITTKSAVDSLLSAGQKDSKDATTPDMFDPDDASALFVSATYPFDASTLESENDAAICLSFNQNDIAFTYNLDESGWGEVILVDSLKRGWVPMNYFKSAVADNITQAEGNTRNSQLANSRIPLRVLFRNAGKFLLNPQSKPFYLSGHLNGYVFDVECFNGITDGVRKLLIDTDCISRSNTVVQRKPIIRRLRKKLLRSWSDLLAKAKEYMHTMDPSKIEYLQLLTFDLLKRAIVFLDVWGVETADSEVTTDEDRHREELSTFTFALSYLPKPPQASYRVNEVYDQLVSYLSLISGRIDLVEHNIQGCRVLETVVGQVNLLVNEYVYLMKYGKAKAEDESSVLRNKGSAQLRTLDSNASRLEQAVEELNSFVRVMIDVATRRNIANNLPQGGPRQLPPRSPDSKLYFYSREGGAIVINACKMIGTASSSYRILKSLISLTHDFTLPSSRRYPNYIEMGIKPAEFVKKCSLGLMGDRQVRRQVSAYRKRSVDAKQKMQVPPSQRYSMFRAGNSGDMQMTDDGLDFLAGVSTATTPFIKANGQFEEMVDTNKSSSNETEIDNYVEFKPDDEIIRSSDGKLLGASFRSLVALLTDEANPPDYFFTSSFFLTFRIFANGSMLLEELITRFDVNNLFVESETRKQIKGTGGSAGFSSSDSQIKTRRRLVCKAFKLWLESYWNPRSDYVLLAPLINFFNEGVKQVLPVEAYQLLVVASKLVGQPPVETMKDKLNYYNNFDSDSQLIPRKISPRLHHKEIVRMSRMDLANGVTSNALMSEMDAYNSFLDDVDSYKLKDVYDADAAGNRESARRSLNIGLHLELNSSSSEPVLLTPRQLQLMQSVVESYRRMLGTHWTDDGPEYTPIDTQTLLDSWWRTSQESWRCMNQSLILLNFNGLEIAKQLSLIESKMFCSIKVGELLNQNFTARKLHLNLSPNIQRSILFTNLLSDYVIESVLQPELEIKQRVHFFKCWLKVAISCLYLRNFNSLASIMTSLQSFLITRITGIWDGLSDKYKDLFNYLTSIIHPDKNYHVYREKLNDFISSNLEEKLEIPLVPYLSLFLQDLTFVVDGNPNYRDNPKSFLNQRLINVDKYNKITQIIADIQTLQVPYRDTGELGSVYNSAQTEQMRTETIKNLEKEIGDDSDVNLADMFDIAGVPCMQELIFLEIWKVKQNNAREDDRNWKMSCAIQPRENDTATVADGNETSQLRAIEA